MVPPRPGFGSRQRAVRAQGLRVARAWCWPPETENGGAGQAVKGSWRLDRATGEAGPGISAARSRPAPSRARCESAQPARGSAWTRLHPRKAIATACRIRVYNSSGRVHKTERFGNGGPLQASYSAAFSVVGSRYDMKKASKLARKALDLVR